MYYVINFIVLQVMMMGSLHMEATNTLTLHVDMRLADENPVQYENFRVVVRIVNPHEFAVTLNRKRNIDMDPIIELIFLDHDPINLDRNERERPMTPDTITLPPHGHFELERFLFRSVDNRIGWPDDKLAFDLRASLHPGLQATVSGKAEAMYVVSKSINLPVQLRKADASEIKAWTWLMDRLGHAIEKDNSGRRPQKSSVQIRIAIEEFLEAFPDSTYAPELRRLLVLGLASEIGAQQISEQAMDAALDSLATNVRYCLKRGGAFSWEMTEWDDKRGGRTSGTLLHAMYWGGRVDVLAELFEAIDQRYPNDENGKLYRQLIIALMEADITEAEKLRNKLHERSPRSKYAAEADEFIKEIKKRQGSDHGHAGEGVGDGGSRL